MPWPKISDFEVRVLLRKCSRKMMQKLKDTRVVGLSSQIFKMRSKMNSLDDDP